MLKRTVLVVLLLAILPLSEMGANRAVACASGFCAEQFEFCEETAESMGGQYLECCTGFCRGPQSSVQCNNDSNQCRCIDIPSISQRR